MRIMSKLLHRLSALYDPLCRRFKYIGLISRQKNLTLTNTQKIRSGDYIGEIATSFLPFQEMRRVIHCPKVLLLPPLIFQREKLSPLY